MSSTKTDIRAQIKFKSRSGETSYEVMQFVEVLFAVGKVFDPLKLKFAMDKQSDQNLVVLTWTGSVTEAQFDKLTRDMAKLAGDIERLYDARYKVISSKLDVVQPEAKK